MRESGCCQIVANHNRTFCVIKKGFRYIFEKNDTVVTICEGRFSYRVSLENI